jgi:hypothetical protein
MRERFSVDAKHLFAVLLKGKLTAFPDYGPIKLVTDPDSDIVLHLPYVVLATNGGRMVSNGPGAWDWIVTLSVVADEEEVASDIADYLYESMYQLKGMDGYVEGVGWVSGVEDLSLPDRTTVSTSPAGDLIQYTGSWTTIVRKK